jgi:hypothetical protein
MSWDAVRQWRDRLRTETAPAGHLSEAGAQEALMVALDALTDDASSVLSQRLERGPTTAAVIAASTVDTAPLPWCAALLGSGATVTLKHPTGHQGLSVWLANTAQQAGLPLHATSERGAVENVEVVVAMGSDATIAAVRASTKGRVLAFGHRFSAAWVRGPAQFGAVAQDVALHDSRGCMSPVAVFTELPMDVAVRGMAQALSEAEARLPRGQISPIEGATLRARCALAQVAGTLERGETWAVLGLPPGLFRPSTPPRTVQVIHVADVQDAALRLAPWRTWLSTIGADHASEFWRAIAPRVCAPGEMQRPTWLEPHDGVDWVAWLSADSPQDHRPAGGLL